MTECTQIYKILKTAAAMYLYMSIFTMTTFYIDFYESYLSKI